MTRPQDAATEALADAWAHAEGCGAEFKRGRTAKRGVARDTYLTYMASSRELYASLKSRGYVIRKARKSG